VSWPPHITVATVVERDGRFLMVEECVDGEMVFNQPAGHLDPGETLFQAAIRETMEETGWEVTLLGVTGLYHYYAAKADIVYHRITFAAEAVRQTSRALDADIHAVHWLSLEEIEQRNLRSPLVREAILDYLQRQPMPLDFIKHRLPK
jgi:8-oxo-dGTP pyrophosphatase MutT (NUDIX family)